MRILAFIICLLPTLIYGQDYKDLSLGDRRALDANVKAYGKVGTPKKIKEYAVYSVESARKRGVSVSNEYNSVVLYREGWAWTHENGQVTRIWNKTGPNGNLYKKSTSSKEHWMKMTIGGKKVHDGFPRRW